MCVCVCENAWRVKFHDDISSKTISYVKDVHVCKHSHPLHLFKFNLPKDPLK